VTQIIDAYTHALTERFYETLVDEFGFQGLTGDPSFLWDMERRLDHMDEFGVDKQVLTLALPPLWRGMDDETALELTRLANDELRQVVDDHPDRFVAVGTVPKASEGFVAEFDRCIEELGMAGVQIFSNVDGQPLDRPRFHPLFECAERHDVPLWMHPQLHEWYDWASEYMDHRLFGWPFDTTLALSRLVFGGVVERYDFDLLAHHGGGMVPFYAGRIDSFYQSRLDYPENYADTDLPTFEQPVSDQFRGFYADTAVSGSLAAHECLCGFFGDHAVFGTDYPFGPGRPRVGRLGAGGRRGTGPPRGGVAGTPRREPP
jgi:aminocarboxymuconate-semialdehyde decarboxylase